MRDQLAAFRYLAPGQHIWRCLPCWDAWLAAEQRKQEEARMRACSQCGVRFDYKQLVYKVGRLHWVCRACRDAWLASRQLTCANCGAAFTRTSTGKLCPACWQQKRASEPDGLHDAAQVRLALQRARKKRLPATLTTAEWKAIRRWYKGLCAYCMQRTGVALDHFIPLECGGGTTSDNCVPACMTCNSIKGPLHPDELAAKKAFTAETWLRMGMCHDMDGIIVRGSLFATQREVSGVARWQEARARSGLYKPHPFDG